MSSGGAPEDADGEESPRLRLGILAAYASPAVPISALGLPLVVYLPPFYAADVGVGLGLVGVLFMVARFWDVFTDPLLGVLSDRLRTRWGRRRPWVAASVPILLLSVYFLFMPPAQVSGVYLMSWLVVLYVGWTLLTISHMSWGAELSPGYHERSRVQGWREFALVSGMLLVLVLPAVVEGFLGGGGRTKVATMGWFIITLLPITVLLAVLRVPERPAPAAPEERLGFRRSLKLVLANRPMLRVLLVDLLVGIAPGITASLYVFFVGHVVGRPDRASLLLLLYFLSGVIGIPIWIRLSYRFGKHRTLSYGMFFTGLVLSFALFVQPGQIGLFMAGNLAYGLGYGAGPFLLRSITADVADADQLESGQQRTGLYFSLLTMSNKVGFALSVGVTYVLLDVIGFDPKAQNSEQTLLYLKLMFVLLPMAMMLLAGLLMYNFPLDAKRHAELRSRLVRGS